MRVNAYAAPSAGEPLAPTTIERREVGAHDVLIAIEYAGICHSDIHTVNGDFNDFIRSPSLLQIEDRRGNVM